MSALSWGAGDFAGGLASRYASVSLAMLVSQSVGMVTMAVIVGLSNEPVPTSASFFWAALAGMSGIGGLACFYRALSGGTMALIAPLAGVIGAAVPTTIAIVSGEHLSTPRLVGVVIGLGAIVLIALPKGVLSAARVWHLSRTELSLTILAGLGFAGFFLFLARASTAGETWWPQLIVRAVGLFVVVAALVVVVARRNGTVRDRLRRVLGLERLRHADRYGGFLGVAPVFVFAGAGDQGGNTFFLFAQQRDSLAVAVVLSSLYPIVTAVLASLLLHERLRRPQVAGVGFAVLAAALIGIG